MNKLTNREWLNSLSNEQFKDFFMYHLKVKVIVKLKDGQIIDFVREVSYDIIIRGNTQSEIGFLEWLAQPCAYEEIVEDKDIYNSSDCRIGCPFVDWSVGTCGGECEE